MEKKAAEGMGEVVLAAARLDNPQFTKAVIGAGGFDSADEPVEQVIGRVLGGAAGRVLAGQVKEASLPGEAAAFYVAVGPTMVAFFSIKRGLFKNSLGDPLVAFPRSDVRLVELGKGYMPAVRFVFADGTHYVFLCARIQVGNFKKVQELLGFAQPGRVPVTWALRHDGRDHGGPWRRRTVVAGSISKDHWVV
jgi:predicted alternative tryptophan synthase beta-subunit